MMIMQMKMGRGLDPGRQSSELCLAGGRRRRPSEGPEAASHSPPDVDQSPFFQDPPPGQMRLVVNRGEPLLAIGW